MSKLRYVKPKYLSIKESPDLNEAWVQELIASDPSIIGLGDLMLKDKERIQSGAGRLDLLLQEAESTQRYEVEIQLGKTDEKHIIRTIEYWDIEKKRYPQYDHCAVIIAEDITSRFLNIISLFNGSIPLIAIQMNAVEINDNLSLIFTKILDQTTLGLVDEDESVAEITDRAYWENKSTTENIRLVDKLFDSIQSFDSSIEPKYTKFYIGIKKNGQANNFVHFRPKKNFINLDLKIDKSDDIERKAEDLSLEMDFDARYKKYKVKLSKPDIKDHSEYLAELLKLAYDKSNS